MSLVVIVKCILFVGQKCKIITMRSCFWIVYFSFVCVCVILLLLIKKWEKGFMKMTVFWNVMPCGLLHIYWLLKNWKNPVRLCIATSRKTIIIITTAVRTSPLAGRIYFRAVVILYTTKMVKIIIFVVIAS